MPRLIKILEETFETQKADAYEIMIGAEWSSQTIDLYGLALREELSVIILNPFLVSLWSLFETVVKRIANDLQKHEGHPLSINDLEGGILKQSEKYYEKVLNINFPQEDWKKIKDIYLLRNIIAHQNSIPNGLEGKKKSKIDYLIRNGAVTIGEYEGYLLPNMEYLDSSFNTINTFLRFLIEKATRRQ